MKTRLLTIAIAVASIFCAQLGVASAKHSSGSSTSKKKHHNKNMKKTSGTKLTAPAAQGRS
jgi:hypothetical protein